MLGPVASRTADLRSDLLLRNRLLRALQGARRSMALEGRPEELEELPPTKVNRDLLLEHAGDCSLHLHSP